MTAVNYIFLALFWTGCVILFKKQNWGLRERVLHFAGSAEYSPGSGQGSGLIKRIRTIRNKAVMERELSEGLAYIKNIVILGKGTGLSSETVLGELADISPVLSPVYLKMASYMHINEKKKASDCLYDAVGRPYARDIGDLLSGWEDIPPAELTENIEAFRSVLLEERDTALQRQDETVSDLLYFSIVANAMAVLLNFVYVGFFIEQAEMLSGLFN